MCAGCDGRIPFDADTCPYCSSAQAAVFTTAPKEPPQTIQGALSSLYPPPYAAKGTGATNTISFKNEIPGFNKSNPLNDPMVEKRFNNSSSVMGAPTIPVEASEEPQTDGGKSSFWPVLLLSLGANLLLLGLLQLLFSDNGFLRLEWDSSYWFAYCLAALPLFFFGFKKVNSLS